MQVQKNICVVRTTLSLPCLRINSEKSRKHFKNRKRYTQQTHQRQINVQTTLNDNVHQRCLNVDIWLEMKLELTYIYQSCLIIEIRSPFLRLHRDYNFTSIVSELTKFFFMSTQILRCFKVDFNVESTLTR